MTRRTLPARIMSRYSVRPHVHFRGLLLEKALGVKGHIINVSFQEATRRLNCYVPDDQLWGAIRDNLFLNEYEKYGISLRRCRGVIVDAGAHVGLFALRAATYASKVVAIEPDPRNQPLLQLNLANNPDIGERIEPISSALSTSGEPVLLYEGHHSGSSSLRPTSGKTHRVSTVTLDQLVHTNGHLDLLKMDIEGAEFDVLRTTSLRTLRAVSAIVAEIHVGSSDDPMEAEITAKLRSAGFDASIVAHKPSIGFWMESVGSMIRNWKKVRRGTRAKLVILFSYSLATLMYVVFRRQGWMNENVLRYLYATQRDQVAT